MHPQDRWHGERCMVGGACRICDGEGHDPEFAELYAAWREVTAERDQLRAEVERLRGELEKAHKRANEELEHVGRLLYGNTSLRALVGELADSLEDHNTDDNPIVAGMVARARAALNGK